MMVALLLTSALTTTAQPEPIRIDLGQKGAVVSPNLYGIFFEEINHAGDGGLYAELIQNRGFEEHVLPSGMTYRDGKVYAPDAMNYEHRTNKNWNIPWNMEEKKMAGWKVTGLKATVKGEVVEAKTPLHQNTPHAMQLDIKKVQKGGKAVLVNTGYWGIGLKAGERYDLRCYVKSANYKGTITARLQDGATGASLGAVTLASRQLKDWTELTATLTAEGTTAKGELALEFDKTGTVLVDYVSLFPQATFKGRKNGQRADVAQMLVDLHPKFMRWPGGCIVEGATYENRVKWKETLGDPMTRRGEWDLWGYRATWGMGYHEFLQFCEDLGMDAMFVNNAGMSCSVRNGDFVSSDADMDAVIQDFRDAIDHVFAAFANHLTAGHGGDFDQPYGGSFARMLTAWLDWQLKGRADCGDIFLKNRLEAFPEWTMRSKDVKKGLSNEPLAILAHGYNSSYHETEADDVAAIVEMVRSWDFIDTGRIALLGCSQGGLVAAIASSQMPEAFKAVVLVYPALMIAEHAVNVHPKEAITSETGVEVMGMPLSHIYYDKLVGYKVPDGAHGFPASITHVKANEHIVKFLKTRLKASR